MKRFRLKLWHKAFEPVQSALDAVRRLPFGIGKKAPDLRKVLTFVEYAEQKDVVLGEVAASAFLARWGVTIEVEEA